MSGEVVTLIITFFSICSVYFNNLALRGGWKGCGPSHTSSRATRIAQDVLLKGLDCLWTLVQSQGVGLFYGIIERGPGTISKRRSDGGVMSDALYEPLGAIVANGVCAGRLE